MKNKPEPTNQDRAKKLRKVVAQWLYRQHQIDAFGRRAWDNISNTAQDAWLEDADEFIASLPEYVVMLDKDQKMPCHWLTIRTNPPPKNFYKVVTLQGEPIGE